MEIRTGKDLVDEAKSRIRQVAAAEVIAMRSQGAELVYLDVREPNEWNLGRVAGATFLPRGNLETKIEGLVPRERTIVVYCANGNRSALAAATLLSMGYPNVMSMSDGWAGWVGEDGEVED